MPVTSPGAVRRTRITGTGMFVPPDVVTNRDLEKLMDTSDEWIQQRSGIKERRYAKVGLGPADLAHEAAKKALDAAGRKASDLDLIIVATLSPDYYFPGTGVFLQDSLGCSTIPALDVRNQCSGFLYGLKTASAFVASGQYNCVLVVGTEVHSSGINLTTEGRDVAVLFGDGAGAIIVEPTDDPERGILSTHLYSEGAHRDLLKIEFPSMRQKPYIQKHNIDDNSIFPKMDGKNVFKHAVRRMPEAVNTALETNKYTVDQVDCFLFHQANLRINEAVMKGLNQPMEKSHNNIEKYGNCSAASIPMCLDEAVRFGKIKEGSLVCMAGFGAGFTWGSALIRW